MTMDRWLSILRFVLEQCPCCRASMILKPLCVPTYPMNQAVRMASSMAETQRNMTGQPQESGEEAAKGTDSIRSHQEAEQ
eukprot:scaffold40051_cov23-Prasinocladus_malaysianus.AAC.4